MNSTSNLNYEDSRKRLIVALDTPNARDARELVDRLGSSVSYYKIGLEMMFDGGLDFAKQLHDEEKMVFLDMKLLDIGNTVEKAVANIAKLNVDFLTIHGLDTKTLKAAIQGRGDSKLRLLAVTVLTNLDDKDLKEQGSMFGPSDLALYRAKLAHSAGFDGVIASGLEAAAIREATDKNFLIKTPGIRPSGDSVGDQNRVMTPRAAIGAGADYIVVGRPITQAAQPKSVADRIVSEIHDAVKSRGL